MVRLLLRMKAELENVESIEFPPDYTYNLDVTQSGGTEERKGVTLSASEEFEIPNSRGTANLILKFGGSKQAATINVEQVKGVTRPYTAADSGKFRVGLPTTAAAAAAAAAKCAEAAPASCTAAAAPRTVQHQQYKQQLKPCSSTSS
ncbi:hypothetical protein Emed_004657 [Eimeria media]